MKKSAYTWMLIASMTIFGTIGVIRRQIGLSSGLIAFSRGVIGGLVLLLFLLLIKKEKFEGIHKKNLLLLFLSGGVMGFNWIFLFEAYNFTTVATATLCYYMEPTIIVLVSFLLFKEKVSLKKWICSAIAVVGMVFVSGVLTTSASGSTHYLGVLFGLLAAILYSIVVLINKRIHGVATMQRTSIQLLSASIVMIPYLLLTEDLSSISIDTKGILLLLLLCLFHTGLAYILYFGSLQNLPTQSIAILSYIDPTVAVLLSALLLQEKMGVLEIVGAVLIIGSALVSEIEFKQKNENKAI